MCLLVYMEASSKAFQDLFHFSVLQLQVFIDPKLQDW